MSLLNQIIFLKKNAGFDIASSTRLRAKVQKLGNGNALKVLMQVRLGAPAEGNRNFYHPYLLTRREPMRDMDPNPCALESTGLQLFNARGFNSKFFTVAIIS